ncbi:MAG: ABC transporter ATP-binding protein, partial [Gemmatimonadetes bacterium]|nr:ABC transporter ATP-binding protein [Gemmatimonadota bacterium]
MLTAHVRTAHEEILHASYDPGIARRLVAFLAPYRRHVAFAFGLILVTALIEAAQPYLVKVAIDRYIAAGDLAGLAGVALLYLGLLLLEAAVGFGRTYLTTWIGQHAMHDLRERLFDRLQRLPVCFFDRQAVGRLVTRVTSDVEVLNDLFSSGVVAILSDAFMLLAIAATMIAIDWRLTLVTLAVTPLIFLVSLALRAPMRDSYRQIRRWVARMNAYLQEHVTGLEIVQLFRREAASEEGFAALNRGHKDAQLRSIRYYSLFYPLVEVLSALAIALVVWYGGGGILEGALTFGALVAFLQYAEKFFRPIRDLAEKYNLLQAAMASGERLIALLDEPLAPAGGPSRRLPEPRGEIVFEDVWFRYSPETWVLKGVSFRVPAGTRLALVGPTGSGKTTCASLLCRFYEPTRGRILLDGVDVRDYPDGILRERVGLVLQDFFLFSRSVAENVHLDAPSIDPARIDAALGALGAERFVAALPQGSDTPVGERGRSLSTGQKQLVAFARALAFDPPVLVLDEATSSVDSATEAVIDRALARLLAGRTAFVIAHRLSTIRRVDRILVLHHGEVREEGTHRELLAAGGLYARLHELQYADEAQPDRAAAPPSGRAHRDVGAGAR